MKVVNKKTVLSLITLSLMLIMMISLFALPGGNAHTPPWTVPTTAYVVCTPETIGVGQSATIVCWVDRYSPTVGGSSGQRWDGFTVNITKPDGKTVIIGPWTCASDVGSDWVNYIPDQVGTYTIVFSWPGEAVTNGTGVPLAPGIPYVGDFFAGSISKPCTLTVEQEPVPNWQEPKIPTDYWTRPINGANRGWSMLGSNWLKGSWLINNFQDEGTVPLSAHVLWSTPLIPGYPGGIIDGRWPGIPSDVNDYESPWSAPIIMDGKIYYNAPAVADSSQHGYYCVDMYTGQQIWYKNGTENGFNNPFTMGAPSVGGPATSQVYLGLTQGQLYRYYSMNGMGVLSYLIITSGTTWYFLDATTGNLIFSLINVPSGTAVTDENGDLLRYSYNTNTGNILCWNSSQAIRPGAPTGTGQAQWKPPQGGVIDAVNDTVWTLAGPNAGSGAQTGWSTQEILPRSGYTMNVTSSSLIHLPGGITSILQDSNHMPKQIFGSSIVGTGGSGISSANPSADNFYVWLVSIDDHVTGYSPFPNATYTQNNNLGFGATLLLNKTLTVPLPGLNDTWSITGVDYKSQTFQLICKQTGQSWCYSLTTGEKLWGPTTSFSQMDYYGLSEGVYYGKLVVCSSYGGVLSAYNISTGNLLWTYNATPGFEGSYGANMPLSIGAICDGTAILYSTEHSPTKPLWHTSYVRCVNLTDGKELWKLLDFNMGLGIADGYIITGNQYDNMIYCIGKGPSAITVSAPQTVPTLGSSVMITGTVTDQSPGVKGTAAVADANQQAWMEYLYEQQAMPTTAKGVTVNLNTIDPNGNYVPIGTVTSDLTGAYGYKWTPEIPGTYQIIATFDGSNSYGSSHAQTYMGIGEAASTPSPYPVALQPPTEMYFAISTVAIVIAIAIVGAVLFIAIKKRP